METTVVVDTIGIRSLGYASPATRLNSKDPISGRYRNSVGNFANKPYRLLADHTGAFFGALFTAAVTKLLALILH